MVIVGHRGAGKLEPDNTLLSFNKAIEIGLNRTEMDVWLTKDGVLIVAHLDEVGYVSQLSKTIYETNFDELKEINLEKKQKIPTLQEVFDVCKNKIDLQIELKGIDTPKPVYDLIIENQIDLSSILITSFDLDLLIEIKKLDLNIKVGYLFNQMPTNIFELITMIPLDYICPKSNLITIEFLSSLSDLDVKVYAFHVPNVIVGNNLLKMGVTDIGTDNPQEYLLKK